MSEYWKSTPKYWCKFCKLFVRDTKTDRSQHEAKPSHQSQIQRSLKDLHREKEREEREKLRAQNEIARLKGLAGGADASAGAPAAKASMGPKGSAYTAPPVAMTPEERKRQAEQLAEMGVAVPEVFRKEMAVAGHWEVVRPKPAPPSEDKRKVKMEDAIGEAKALGVKKRKIDEDEEENGASKRKPWGSSFKTVSLTNDDDDIEALFGSGLVKKERPEFKVEEDGEVKQEFEDLELKQSESGEGLKMEDIPTKPPGVQVKKEGDEDVEAPKPSSGVIFKKRKKPVKKT